MFLAFLKLKEHFICSVGLYKTTTIFVDIFNASMKTQNATSAIRAGVWR
jgi:hypothetical protein